MFLIELPHCTPPTLHPVTCVHYNRKLSPATLLHNLLENRKYCSNTQEYNPGTTFVYFSLCSEQMMLDAGKLNQKLQVMKTHALQASFHFIGEEKNHH